jgi:ribonuclease HI
LTVKEAEYRGMLLGYLLLGGLDVVRLIVCGDSNLIIRQMREEMDCKSPGLKLLRERARRALQMWPRHDLFHVRRDWICWPDKPSNAKPAQKFAARRRSKT